MRSGEVVGLAGLRGAGRTEVLRAIFGADPIDGGRIYVAGKETRIDSPRVAVAAGLGLVPEDRGTQGLFKNLSAQQNIFMASVTSGLIDYRGEREKALQTCRDLQIKLPALSTLVGRLSGGNQQKVVLAKWLEAGVRILLLDEPTRGVDVGSKAQIYSLVRELCRKGLGVLLVSSELPEIVENCDRVLVMHRGAIAAELPRGQATEEAIISYAVGASVMTGSIRNVAAPATRRSRTADAALMQTVRDYKVILVPDGRLLIVTAIWAPEFFGVQNLINVARQAAITGVVAVGMTFVILTAGIDLSVGSTLALCGIMFALLHQGEPGHPDRDSRRARVWRPHWNRQRHRRHVPGDPAVHHDAGDDGDRQRRRLCSSPMARRSPFDTDSGIVALLGNGNVGGLPGPVIVFVLVAVVGIFVLRYLPFGRFVYGIGGGLEAARLSGVRTARVLIMVYAISGVCASIAGSSRPAGCSSATRPPAASSCSTASRRS